MKFISAVPVFHLSDIKIATDFYVCQLGFSVDFTVDDYVGLKHADVNLHVTSNKRRAERIGKGHVYIIINAIDDFYKTITDKGVVTDSSPTDFFYGMREFELTDPDGNLISFGSEINNV